LDQYTIIGYGVVCVCEILYSMCVRIVCTHILYLYVAMIGRARSFWIRCFTCVRMIGSVYNYWIRYSMCVRTIIQYACADYSHTHTRPVRRDDREGSQRLNTVEHVCVRETHILYRIQCVHSFSLTHTFPSPSLLPAFSLAHPLPLSFSLSRTYHTAFNKVDTV